MPNEPTELGRFGFGIKIIRYPHGDVVFETQQVNQGVPEEIVIMKMRACLNNMEKNYFDKFDKGTSTFDKKE